MGILISRFFRKRNAEQQLEELTDKIKKIEEFQEDNADRLRLSVRHLIIYSTVLYLLSLCIYFLLKPEKYVEYFWVLMLMYPFIIYLLRKFIIFYYKRKIIRNKTKIELYKKEKENIITKVKEKETYLVAKQILDKYDTLNQSFSRRKDYTPIKSTPIPIPKSASSTNIQTSTELRKRNTKELFFSNNYNNQIVGVEQRTPAPKLVRPIISQNKGVFDKIIQKVVGDGPNERFALICRGCGSHNGMALQEEFEYLAYRCAFCSYFNPARKQRPVVLREALAIEPRKSFSDCDSTSEEKTSLKITELENSETESDLSSQTPAKTSQDASSSSSQNKTPATDVPKEKEEKDEGVVKEKVEERKENKAEVTPDEKEDRKEEEETEEDKMLEEEFEKIEKEEGEEIVKEVTGQDENSPMEVDLPQEPTTPTSVSEPSKDANMSVDS